MYFEENRELLPKPYEKKYQSEYLKKRIADIGLWTFIPGVNPDMNSPSSHARLKENDLLFSFLDKYCKGMPYAFEPFMADGRFVLLPEDVGHQGLAIMVSKIFPGFFDIVQFWYPCEYVHKVNSLPPNQACLPVFAMKPGAEVVRIIKKYYLEQKRSVDNFCTFLFDPNTMVRLDGYFLDSMPLTENKIRNTLTHASSTAKKNGEKTIAFMKDILSIHQ